MAILQKSNPKISIIILNYQTDELVLNLLRLIDLPAGRTPPKALPTERRQELEDLEIIVIDNSSQNTLSKKLPRSSNIRHFFQNKNIGFSAGNNVGIKKAKGEWILLLNSDTVTNEKEIRRLMKTCRDNNCEVGAPQLKNKEGSIQNTVGYFDSSVKHIINCIFLRPRFIKCESITENTQVDLAIGAALLVKKTVFEKVGLLDQKNFFMYFEDMDFCYRLFKHKIPILYIPKVQITHYGGESADKDKNQKNSNYQKGLNNYIKKYRGRLVLSINKLFKFFS